MEFVYFIARLIVSPFVLAWILILGIVMLLAAFGLWLLDGRGRTARTSVGDMHPPRYRRTIRYRR